MPLPSPETLQLIRDGMKKIKQPSSGNKVYKDECCYSFTNPYSPDNGLYVNLSTWLGCGERFLKIDSERSDNNILYMKFKYEKVPKEAKESNEVSSDAAPTKLAIGVEGGFDPTGDASFELKKSYFLSVFDPKQGKIVDNIPYPFSTDDPELNNEIPSIVSMVLQAIEKHAGAAVQDASNVWSDQDDIKPSKYADNLIQLPYDKEKNGSKISPDPSTWACEIYGNKDNLWLNLSDGFIGGGRKNWDGSGGSGGALEHYNQEKEKGNEFPLVVKLGTITGKGADVYSYAKDENDAVIDTKLAEHLSHWGIDVMKLEKTEKTTAELSVELNNAYDWSKVCESGTDLVRLNGPRYRGFANLGNTCYMNSAFQILCSLPEIGTRYMDPEISLRLSCGGNMIASDVISQMSKLVTACNLEGELEKSRSPPSTDSKNPNPNDDSNTIAMRMFRAALVESHSDFSSNKQQDSEEFLRYVFDRLGKAERKALNDKRIKQIDGNVDTLEDLFTFKKVEKYESNEVTNDGKKEVAYIPGVDCFLPLQISLEDAVTSDNTAAVASDTKNSPSSPGSSDAALATNPEGTKKQKLSPVTDGNTSASGTTSSSSDPIDGSYAASASTATEVEAIPEIPFEKAVARLFGNEDLSSSGSGSSSDGSNGVSFRGRKNVSKCLRLESMPKYLLIQIQRYYVCEKTWSHKKRECTVPVPEFLDLEPFRAGKRGENGLGENEVEMKEVEEEKGQSTNTGTTGNSTSGGPIQPDMEIVNQLLIMGFSENGCKRACINTQNTGVETASEWIFAHMEDQDFNDPIPEGGLGTGNSAAAAGSAATSNSAAPKADPELVSMLQMITGYPEKYCNLAALQNPGNPDGAAGWLMERDESQLEDLIKQAEETLSGNGRGNSGSSGNSNSNSNFSDGPGKYSLIGFISHVGKATSSGHYVAHVKKDGNCWVLFDDEKVGKSEKTPFEYGYVYCFRREG